MISLREWRKFREETSPAVTDIATPTAQDWEYYKRELQGKAMTLLEKFIASVSPDLNPARKGFILQEVIQVLKMTPSEVLKIVNHINRSQPPAQAAPPPAPGTAPVPSSSPPPQTQTL